MSHQQLSHEAISDLQRQFPQSITVIGEGFQQALQLETQSLLEIMTVLKNNAAYQFNMASNLTAVDYLDYFEIVYHLYSLPLKHAVTIKVRCSIEQAMIPSVMSIWPSVNFQEREVYDLFGITFIGHSDLRRILLPDDFIEHPLRKGYKLPVREERRL